MTSAYYYSRVLRMVLVVLVVGVMAVRSEENAAFCPKGFTEDNVGKSTEFSVVEANALYSPFSCGLLGKAVTYVTDDDNKTTALKMTLSNEGCPKDCGDYDYSCGQAASLEKLGYGTYTCVMKPSSVPGVISSCHASNNGKDQDEAEIYFRVYGNMTYFIVGVKSNGIISQQKINLLLDQDSYSTFQFNWTSKSVSFKVNGHLVKTVQTQWAADRSIPKPPMVFFTSIYNDNGYVKNISLPASAYVDKVSYQPVKCTNDSSDSSVGDQWHWEESSPLWYFTSNCTLYRPEWVYNDSYIEPWVDASYSFRKTEDPVAKKRGQFGISFDLKENTGVYFKSEEPFKVLQHKFLTFWINGAVEGNQQMIIYFIGLNRTKVASLNLGDYVRGGLQPQRWYKVILPMRHLQLNPPETQVLTGFLFQQAYNAYMGQVYVDDLFFSNGSNCIDRTESVDYYTEGKLKGGASGDYSTGSVDFASRGYLYKQKPTIEWRVMSSNVLKMAFENGTIDTSEYDGLLITLFYVPDQNYQFPNSDPNAPQNAPPREVQAKVQVQIDGNFYEGVGLAEYVGGEFPSKKWIDLNIPFYDLSCGENQEIQAIQMTSYESQYQGAIYIGRIEAVKYADPPSEDSGSIQLSTQFLFTIFLILLSIIIM